jgi:hypothetical protein
MAKADQQRSKVLLAKTRMAANQNRLREKKYVENLE